MSASWKQSAAASTYIRVHAFGGETRTMPLSTSSSSICGLQS
jgi:hypothetical protein